MIVQSRFLSKSGAAFVIGGEAVHSGVTGTQAHWDSAHLPHASTGGPGAHPQLSGWPEFVKGGGERGSYVDQ